MSAILKLAPLTLLINSWPSSEGHEDFYREPKA